MTDSRPTIASDGDPASRVAVVTGAARGIGRSIAERLAVSGHRVALVDISPEVDAAAEALVHAGHQAIPVRADVSDPDDVAAAVQAVTASYGGVDILVNNAALTAVHRPWSSVLPEDWDDVMAVNLKSAFLFARLCVPLMEVSGWGRIVNISSVTFLSGQRQLIDYVSSKGGMIGLTRALAREVGASGITVNAVMPGAIRTEAELAMFEDQEQIAREQALVQSIPRRGLPEDVAAVVAFFCSDDASFVTGQSLTVDGGWLMH